MSTDTTVRISNTWGQLQAARAAGLPDVAIATHYSLGGRERYRDGWEVFVPGRDVSEGQKQHWMETVHREDRARIFHRHEVKAKNWREAEKLVLELAVEWCRTRFPEVKQWKRNHMGDYVDVRVNERFPLEKRT